MTEKQKNKILTMLVKEAESYAVGSAERKTAIAQIVAIQKVATEEEKAVREAKNKSREIEVREKDVDNQNAEKQRELDLKEKELQQQQLDLLQRAEIEKRNRKVQIICTILSALTGGATTIGTLVHSKREARRQREFLAFEAAECRKYESEGSYTSFSSKQIMNDVLKQKK